MLRGFSVGLVLAFLAIPPATAQDLQKGLTAYNRGDYATALKNLYPLAAKGDAQAQYNLAVMYRRGQGVPRDDAEAVAWFRRAAKLGYAKAQYNLAFMYLKGQGVPRDDAEAVARFRKAAKLGYAKAQYNLALMYLRGQGVPRDDAEAVARFRKAAEQGNAKAQYNLAVLYLRGQGVPRNDAEAAAWLRKAARQGNGKARKKLRFLREEARARVSKAPSRPPRGDFRVQLGAVKMKARAVKEARRLNRVHGSVLGRLKIVPVRANLGKRGVYYRLRAGPLHNRASANSICHALSARKQACLVVRP